LGSWSAEMRPPQQSQSYGEEASSGYCQWRAEIPNLRRNKNPPLAVNK
jgi:hypothetical protein